ncbi:hypothetical protein ASPWEDRAFT_119873 [Aspergillus wentii DTO 134E9]|uniref:Aminotransferase class I/classII large domain-containing protein n=1 Tax=Aspergillus wentii DTO 134E9 TaxID=1073089 RepID=A0A1L9R9S6_ASPWE|nr:uncharacterized protein ASPWEDRAFT_119873 [Aspergillus wentii DTO 134E9]OJJ31674.1 hypothetical protein ASPWEDRAFT_119873 [Aspergillus wentii DTO 134E9]
MPLTMSDIESIRAQSAPLPSTVAPYTCSDFFKSPHNKNKPPSKPINHHFSIESSGFTGSALKKLGNSLGGRKVISLATGRPTADYYPWESVTFEGSSLGLQQTSNGIEAAVQTVRKYGDVYTLSTALNYGHGAGCPSLVRFLTEHVEMVHDPPYADWEVCLSSGSTAAFEIALRIFCNRGDIVLAEKQTYPGSIEAAGLVGVQFEGLKMDAEGLMADALQSALTEWDASRGPKPRVLYTIPTGHNPTGATQSTERRQQIYGIAEEHDLIIIEDDPYYFLRMGSYHPGQEASIESSGNLPSYVSLDRSGRVVRLDSTSKLLAPGLRAGWVTASAQIINKFISYHEVTTGAVSGPSQLMLWTLLEQSWGHRGFGSWLDHLSSEYRCRRDIMLSACGEYLPEVCDWVPPEYGMFVWIRLDWKKHPLFRGMEIEESDILLAGIAERINLNAIANGVQVTKGFLFSPNMKPNGELQFRMTFAAAARTELEEGVRIFGDVVRKEFS